MKKARIFISCGQKKGTHEEKIANEIAEELDNIGFNPYLAIEEQTLSGLKENIFQKLRESEYLLFIDFRRELIGKDKKGKEIYRGSLYCHQELAVASFLEDIKVLPFREDGVIELDGMTQAIQLNSTLFSNPKDLPALVLKKVKDKIKKKEWSPNWKNELSTSIVAQYADAYVDLQRTNWRRFFHINVRNNHLHKPALNCYAYIESIKDIGKRTVIPVRTVELKWEGYTLPNAMIAARGYRTFDAFWVPHAQPSSIGFNLFSDSTKFWPQITTPGKFEIVYLVVSENFEPIKQKTTIKIGQTLDDIEFYP